MTRTHCLPNGVLAAHEVPVPAVSDANVNTIVTAAAGSRRGVVVALHGIPATTPQTIPYPIADAFSIVPVKQLTIANALATAGWVYIQPSYPEDFQPAPATAIHDDVYYDTTNGARFLASTLRWWDHVVKYIEAKYGTGIPIIPYGISWGGWHALEIAKNRLSTVTGYAVHIPLVQLNLLSSFTDITSSAGMDISSTHANTITVPGYWIWHTGDTVVGYTAQQTVYNNAVTAGRTLSNYTEATGHYATDNDVTGITGWFSGTMAPLCPATH